MIQKIHAWLNDQSGSYQEGLLIYNENKISNKHDAFFAQVSEPGRNDIHFRMLLAEVRKIAMKLQNNPHLTQQPVVKNDIKSPAKPIKTEPISLPKTVTRARIVKDNEVMYEKLPAELRKKYDRNVEIVKQMGGLHAKMKAVPEGDQHNGTRSTIVTEIATLEKEKDSNWSNIDNWYRESFSEREAPKETDPEVIKAKQYLGQNYKSTNEKVIAKCSAYKSFLTSKGIDWLPK